jgi:pyruvate kinase
MGMTRRTKIVATIGPSSREPADLRAILEAGVDVCRINCSHATHDAIERDIARIRRLAVELGRHVGILLDLQGPKIRTGEIEPPLTLVRGDLLEIVMDPDFHASGKRVGTTWPTPVVGREGGRARAVRRRCLVGRGRHRHAHRSSRSG